MNAKKIVIRPATASDAKVIAQAVVMAIGDDSSLREYCGENYIEVVEEIVLSEGTQYCWLGALIAEVDGEVAGAVVGYDGGELQRLREGTFSIIRKRAGFTPSISDETEAGEYYLDSVAVLPHFRGLGVAHSLIEAFCERAHSEGHNRVGLIVDEENPQAQRLYTSLGFVRIGTRDFFGHKMWHLQREL